MLSPGSRPGDLAEKLIFYRHDGVEEYDIYDPDDGSLVGRSRRGNRLVKIARMAGFVSPLLGVRFEPGRGEDNLTIIGRDGRPFITPLEIFRHIQEQGRLAEAERQLAETERLRAERYAAKLRELGLQPD